MKACGVVTLLSHITPHHLFFKSNHQHPHNCPLHSLRLCGLGAGLDTLVCGHVILFEPEPWLKGNNIDFGDLGTGNGVLSLFIPHVKSNFG